MTNEQIIMLESVRLMNDGILSGSGIYGSYTDKNGNEIKIELPESIHTFAAWKALGFIVRKGEHAIASFPVWTYREKRGNGADENQEENGETDGKKRGKMYLKKAFFFRSSQVEKLQCNA